MTKPNWQIEQRLNELKAIAADLHKINEEVERRAWHAARKFEASKKAGRCMQFKWETFEEWKRENPKTASE